MAQDLETIIQLLNDIQRTNAFNADNFDTILSGISSKIDTNNSASNSELLNTYIGELSKSIDEKYTYTLNKFEDIEKALKAVYDTQDNHVKNSDMKELFDILSKNINNFYTEARQEKAILSGIESKIADLSSNKTDKEDILRTISLLRNDMGNINLSYKNTVDDINTTLKSILSGIKSVDPLKTGDTTKTQIDIMFKAFNDILSNIHDINVREDNFEKILANVVTSEDLKLTDGIIDSIVEKTNSIEEKLNNCVSKNDIEDTQLAISYIKEKSDLLSTSEDFANLKEETANLISYTDEIKQTLSSVAMNIDNIPNSEEVEANLKKLYSHIYELSNNVENYNVKADVADVNNNLSVFKEELGVIKNIIADCDEVVTSKLVESLDKISSDNDDLKRIVTEISSAFPQKEDIEKILEDSLELNTLLERTEKISQELEALPAIQNNIDDISTKHSDLSLAIDNLKNNFDEIYNSLEKLSKSTDIADINAGLAQIEAELAEIKNTFEANSVLENSQIIERLDNLQNLGSEILSREEFNNYIEELKSCISSLSLNTGSCSDNLLEMQNLQKKIDDRLSELDFSGVAEILDSKLERINEKIEQIHSVVENNSTSMSEFIKNNTGLDNEYIKSELNEIKSIIEANMSDFDNADANNKDNEAIKEYLDEVKNLIQDNSKSPLYSKVMEIEDSIVNNQTFNESAYSQILEKIEHYHGIKDKSENNEQIENAISEISGLKAQIDSLVELYNNKEEINIDNPEDAYIARFEEFLAGKFEQIRQDLTDITNSTDTKLSDSITYRAELLEQKIGAIEKLLTEQNLTKDLDNPEFTQKLSSTSEKLDAFRQEFQLAVTDVTENVCAQTNNVLEEIQSIKVLLDKISQNKDPEILKNKVEELNEELTSAPELDDISFEFEELYSKLNDKLNDNGNNLKDFILTETDSIILKFENLKEYIEQSVESILPPDENSIKEIKDFISEIKNFREEQENLFVNSANEIKQEIKTQSEEIKSMFAIASNHEDIIDAIERLKASFKKAAGSSKQKAKAEDAVSENVSFDEDAILDLKADFKKYSKIIEKLSDDNSQITEVLSNISNRLEEMTKIPEIKEGNEIDDSELNDTFEVTEDDIFGEDKFDFVQAFDILQNDIRNLHSKIEVIQKNQTENKEASKIPAINNTGMIMTINSKVDNILKSMGNDWLKDLQTYIKNGNQNINLKLDSIGSKLDIFVSDTTNTDLLNNVSDNINDLNDTITDLAPKVDSIVPSIELLSDSDKKLTSMLEELNTKIGEMASDNSGLDELNSIKALIGEQKSYIEELEPSEKLEAFKKCLDEITFEVNALATDSNADREKLQKTIKDMKESLMSAVISIFDQVSFIEESEDIKDFVEERTDEINERISQITKQLQQLASADEKTDYTYSMQDIETDLAKLRLALQDSTQPDLSEITDKISKLKEQTEFLIATSDKSYNALNTGIVGFEEIIHDNITDRVDKLSAMLENSAESDRVIRQALVYMGEWIDSASKSINKISSNSDEITRINDVLVNINNVTQNINEVKNSINIQVNSVIEKRFAQLNEQLKNVEKQFVKMDSLENQLLQQQERIDRLENNIDKLVSIVENIEDPGIPRKIDKIEKQISKLGVNIEKLASYVD